MRKAMEPGHAGVLSRYGKSRLTAKDWKAFLPYGRGSIDVTNPNLKWKAPKVLTKGDDCCELVVSEAAPIEER